MGRVSVLLELLEGRRLLSAGVVLAHPPETWPILLAAHAGAGHVYGPVPKSGEPPMHFNTMPWMLTSADTSISGAIANFTGSLDQYTATIDWGDGTRSAGDIQVQPDGSSTVVGSHDFGTKGSFFVMVEVD